MLRLIHVLVLTLGLVVVAAFSFTCDGGEAEEPEPTETATVEPTSTPEPPLGLDSFHYSVALEIGIDEPGTEDDSSVNGMVEGDFAAPWSHAWEQTFNVGAIGGTESFVIIGDDAWKRDGNGEWQQTTASDPEVTDSTDLTAADPDFLSDLEFTNELGAIEGEPEEVNGVQTLRYDLSDSIAALVDIFGTDFFQGDAAEFQDLDMVVWLEEDTNTLVRADLTALAGPDVFGDAPFAVSPDADVTIHMTIDISKLNDTSIDIEPPI